MLKNAMGASPFSLTMPYNSSVSVFSVPDSDDSLITIKIDEKPVYQGSKTLMGGIYVLPNQTISVEIAGGGDVFLSILEENLKLLGGVAIASESYQGDGVTSEFALPKSLSPANAKAEVRVIVDGLEVDFELSEDKSKVVFERGVYLGAKVKVILTKPQEYANKEQTEEKEQENV